DHGGGGRPAGQDRAAAGRGGGGGRAGRGRDAAGGLAGDRQRLRRRDRVRARHRGDRAAGGGQAGVGAAVPRVLRARRGDRVGARDPRLPAAGAVADPPGAVRRHGARRHVHADDPAQAGGHAQHHALAQPHADRAHRPGVPGLRDPAARQDQRRGGAAGLRAHAHAEGRADRRAGERGGRDAGQRLGHRRALDGRGGGRTAGPVRGDQQRGPGGARARRESGAREDLRFSFSSPQGLETYAHERLHAVAQTLRFLAAAARVLTAAAPAQAEPAPPAEDAPQASSYPPPATLVAAQAAGDRLDTAKKTRPVAPGITLTSFDRLDPLGWLRADALTADLGGGASADYVFSGEVSKTEPLSGPAGRSRAVAAVNGDFFDINNSGAAQGIGVQNGELIQSPIAGHDNAVAISGDGVGRVLKMHFDGTATPEDGTPITLTQFNQRIQAGGVGLF